MTSTLTSAERAELWDRRGEVFVAALQESRRSNGRGFGREGTTDLTESQFLWENRGRVMLGGERLEAALAVAPSRRRGIARSESTTIHCRVCKDASKSSVVESICRVCGL